MSSSINYQTYEELLQTVQDAWNGMYDVDAFRRELRRYHQQLLNPAEPRPDPKSKEIVESKQVQLPGSVQPIHLKDFHVQTILGFSDNHNLNELEVVRLFLAASEEANRRQQSSSASVRNVAYQIYYARRRNLLLAVLDLVLMYDRIDQFPENMVLIVDEFVQELLRNGFIQNMIQLVRDLALNTLTTSVSHESWEAELRMAIQILFVMFGKHNCTADDLIGFVTLIRDCCTGVLDAIPGYSDGQFRDLQGVGLSDSRLGSDGLSLQPGSQVQLLGTLSDVLLGSAPIASPSSSFGGLVGAARATTFSMRGGKGTSYGVTGFHVYMMLIATIHALDTKYHKLSVLVLLFACHSCSWACVVPIVAPPTLL